MLLQAHCPTCDLVTITGGEVELVTGSAGTFYRFACPSCELIVCHPADRLICEVLLAAGARPVAVRWPDELAEPHTGPAIGESDISEFACKLASAGLDGEIVRLPAATVAAPSDRQGTP
jgi:hypothetical protein